MKQAKESISKHVFDLNIYFILALAPTFFQFWPSIYSGSSSDLLPILAWLRQKMLASAL